MDGGRVGDQDGRFLAGIWNFENRPNGRIARLIFSPLAFSVVKKCRREAQGIATP